MNTESELKESGTEIEWEEIAEWLGAQGEDTMLAIELQSGKTIMIGLISSGESDKIWEGATM